MTQDQITGILRAVLAAAGGFFVGNGTLNAENWQWIAGGVLTIVPAVWSWLSNRPSSMAATVRGLPGVTVTTTSAAPRAVVEAVAAAKNP